MAADDEGASITVDAKNKTATISGKKTAEVIAILSLVVLGIMGVALWQHSTESKAGTEKLNDALERMVQGQTQATCLLGFPEQQRESKARWCEDLARSGRR